MKAKPKKFHMDSLMLTEAELAELIKPLNEDDLAAMLQIPTAADFERWFGNGKLSERE